MDPTLADLLMIYSSRSVIPVYLYPLPSTQNQISSPWQCSTQWLPYSQCGTADGEQLPEVNETPVFNQELNTFYPNTILSSQMGPVLVNQLPEVNETPTNNQELNTFSPTNNQELHTFSPNTLTSHLVGEPSLSSQMEPVLVNPHYNPKQYALSYNIKEEDVLCPIPQPRSKIEKQTLVTIDPYQPVVEQVPSVVIHHRHSPSTPKPPIHQSSVINNSSNTTYWNSNWSKEQLLNFLSTPTTQSPAPIRNRRHSSGHASKPYTNHRTNFNSSQLFIMATRYKKSYSICKEEREILAEEIGVSETAIRNWFQNRKAKERRAEDVHKQITNAAVTGDF